MRVCVVGLGYIGLPTALMLAKAGHEVVGYDISARVLDRLRGGIVPDGEPGLAQLFDDVRDRITYSAEPVEADAFIIAVPTPVRGRAHKQADLSAVRSAAAAVAPLLRAGNLVVLESTSPPGTTRDVLAPALGRSDVLVAHCPERVTPGRILQELVHADRVVGGVDPASAEAARALYATFVKAQIHVTDATTAELVKLMENTHRDVNIALANEFALVAERVGVDVWRAIELANKHPRVQILRPGPGVGGHCIAVDPWFVVGAAPQFTPLIAASRAVNDAMPAHVADLVGDLLGGLAGTRILALGLTYKADVDDTRESPSHEVIEELQRGGAEVVAHDAMVRAEQSVEELARGADCVLLLVDHKAYRDLDPAALSRVVRRPIALDTRNALAAEPWLDAGFTLARLGDGRARVGQPVLAG